MTTETREAAIAACRLSELRGGAVVHLNAQVPIQASVAIREYWRELHTCDAITDVRLDSRGRMCVVGWLVTMADLPVFNVCITEVA